MTQPFEFLKQATDAYLADGRALGLPDPGPPLAMFLADFIHVCHQRGLVFEDMVAEARSLYDERMKTLWYEPPET